MAKVTLSDLSKVFKEDKKPSDFHYYGQIVSVDRENRTYEVSINRDESITVEAARLVGAGVGDTVMVTVMANGYATVTGRVGGDMDASDAQRTADNASDAASSALSQARSAAGTASQAQSKAAEALGIANNAVELAEQAEEEAGRASTAATQAAASASSAEADASRAATSAQNAEADAASASTSAQNAAASASSASTSASNAATSAQNAASDAASAATSASNAEADASSAATSAQSASASAQSAASDASSASSSATAAAADAATARQQSSAATTAANEAKTQAQAAETAANEAKADASSAKRDAAAANTAANGAVAGLAVVQGVVDQLETDVDDMQTHVAMMNAIDDGDVHIPAGLHVVPSASGYFMVIANDGVYVYDNESVLVAKYGHNIVYDSNREHKIGNNTSYIRYYDSNNDGVADAIEIVADNIRLGSYSVGDKITATETTLNNYMSSNNTRVGNVETSVTTTTTNLTNYITSNNQAIESLERQIDGAIDTWYYSGVPTLNNDPAINWPSNTYESHERDLYFDTSTGHTYRFARIGNTEPYTYEWIEIQDADALRALQAAAAAQDTADHKRRVFVTTPAPPYEIGDLWVQGQNGDIFRCATPKTSQQSYDLADWVKASKYTDDTKANAVESDLHTNYYVKSDFSVAPDRIASTISATETTVKTYADGKASAAESNAKTYADGKASTAETNAKTYADNNFDSKGSAASALDDAKDYADDNFDSKGSASAAQAAAISAAAADATSKANAAESNAKTAAAADATSKANAAKQAAIDDAASKYYTKTQTYTKSEIEQRAEEISISVTKEIKDETIYYYLASNKSSGVKITDPGWTRTPQTTTDEKPYLWVYAIVATGSKTESPEPTLISGPMVTFESEAADLPLNKLEIKIDPQQDLHGYERPWAPGTGKNKLQITATSRTVNGVTFTVNADGTIKANGTATADAIFVLNADIHSDIATGTSIIVNGCPSGGSGGTYRIYCSNVGYDYGSGVTGIVPSTACACGIAIFNGYTANNLVFKPMIRLASVSDATFEPYSNICQISGWNEVEMSSTGKNLFDNNFAHYTRPFDYRILPIDLKQGETYTFSIKLTGTEVTGCTLGFVKAGIRYYDFQGFDIFINSSGRIPSYTQPKHTVTVDASFTAPALVVYASDEAAFNSLFENYEIQLEVGNENTEYEPYAGTKSLLYDGINVWDEEWELGGIDATTGQNYASNVIIRSKNYIPVKGGETYRVYIGGSSSLWIAILTYDAGKNFLANAGGKLSGASFTLDSNVSYIRFYVTSNYGAIYNNDISINYPSTEYGYHPYNETGTVYGGTIDVLTGVMTNKLIMVTDFSNISMSRSSTSQSGKYRVRLENMGGKPTSSPSVVADNLYCNVLETVTANNTYTATQGVSVDDNGYIYIYVDGLDTVENYRAWLASNNVQLCYELAEPQTIQLTPHQINTFLGQNNIWANAGDTTVEYWSRAIPSALYLSGTDDSTDGEKIVSRINLQPGTVKIEAKNIEIDGTATFNAIKSQADAAYDSKGSASTAEQNAKGYADGKASTKADKTAAVAEEQYIYKSAASGTSSMSGTTTWVSDATGAQNTWTTKRPQYNSSYPVLFVAKQKKTVSNDVTCTTPFKDDTTTVIDGGHITTGAIDASAVTVNNIDASKITTGTLSADRIAAGSLTIGKVNGLQTTLDGKADDSDIPTKVSDLSNDSGFQNSTQVSDAVSNGIAGASVTDLADGSSYPTTSDLDDLLDSKQDAGDYITDSDFDERISDIVADVNTLNGHILFGDDGRNTFILLQNYDKDNPETITGVQAKLTSDKLAFGTFGSVDNEVAYFSSEELKVQKRLSFGNFVMKQRDNGHLSIMFEGGDD